MPDKAEITSVPPPSVQVDYVHSDKLVTPKAGIMLGPRRLKWYDIGRADLPVPPSVHQMARTFLERRVAVGELSQLGDLGFIILHRCGEDFYFLIASSWRGNNELWETVYARDASDADFRDFPLPGPHRGTYCVWEMGAVFHEQQAWRHYLLSKRDEKHVTEWLADQYDGPV